MKKSILTLGIIALVACTTTLNAQVTIGQDKNPEAFSVLELIVNADPAKAKGLRLPQMSTAQRNAMTDATFRANPEAQGLQIFNTDSKCVETWNSTKWIETCTPFDPNDYGDLDPADGTMLIRGNVCFDTKETDNVNSNGILANRNPATETNPTGTAEYPLTVSGITVISVDVWEVTPSVTGLVASHDGANQLTTLTLTWEALATIRAAVPNSTRNATNIVITAYVTTSAGKKKISKTVYVHDFVCCGAKISSSEWKAFMCHNLGATETADPFTLAAAINGDYYQWGYKYPSATRDAVLGTPTAPAISTRGSWLSTASASAYYGNNSLNDNTAKSSTDPCPSGYRVPSYAEWDGVLSNNTRTNKGPWVTASETNYSGSMFGSALFLPVAGYRNYSGGSLYSRGTSGYYWSTRKRSGTGTYCAYFNTSDKSMYNNDPAFGFSVRCITE
jgi:uncharacterized protein (TIGR02145 family)